MNADAARRQRIRRSTIALALLAIGVYVLFIALAVRKGS